MLKGGDSGPAIVPGNSDESLLISALKYDGYEMATQGEATRFGDFSFHSNGS